MKKGLMIFNTVGLTIYNGYGKKCESCGKCSNKNNKEQIDNVNNDKEEQTNLNPDPGKSSNPGGHSNPGEHSNPVKTSNPVKSSNPGIKTVDPSMMPALNNTKTLSVDDQKQQVKAILNAYLNICNLTADYFKENAVVINSCENFLKTAISDVETANNEEDINNITNKAGEVFNKVNETAGELLSNLVTKITNNAYRILYTSRIDSISSQKDLSWEEAYLVTQQYMSIWQDIAKLLPASESLNTEDTSPKSGDTEKQRKELLELYKKLDELSYKSLKKINLEYSYEDIEDPNNEIETIKQKLDEKQIEIANIINEQETYCKTKDDFISKFNTRFNEIKPMFPNYKFKELESGPNADVYYKTYQEMTGDIFNHKIALELQIYRYILNLTGFTKMLVDLAQKKELSYWFLRFFNKKEFKYKSCFTFFNKKTKQLFFSQLWLKKGCEKLDIDSGSLTVGLESSSVKCEGCDNPNCISCCLKKILTGKDGTEEGLDKFVKIFKQQGQSSDSAEAMSIKRIIFIGLKKELSKFANFYSIPSKEDLEMITNKKKMEGFKRDIDDEFLKYVMIEWALTVEFMRIVYPSFDKSNKDIFLYRTFGRAFATDKKFDLNEVKSDLYESTSLIAPCFLPSDCKKVFKSLCFTKTSEPVKFYRCFFNHIISPNNECILMGDYEHEIGYIGINKKYKEINVGEFGDYIENCTINNMKKNIGLIDEVEKCEHNEISED